MNRRFALPGGDVELYELGTEAPVWWEDWNDAPRGRGTSGSARSLPRHEHVPEDHGDVRQRRDLEPARVVHARRHRRQGRHSAAGHGAPLLLPRRHARRRPRRIQQRGDSGQRLRAAGESGAERADAIRVDEGASSHGSRPARRCRRADIPTIADGTLVPDTDAAMGFPADSRATRRL